MANITAVNNFVGQIELPTYDPNITATIGNYITRLEKEYLKKVFGLAFYNLFIAGIVAPVSGDRWYKILHGASYTNADEVLTEWQGFSTVGVNPIAIYIYYWYRRDNVTATTLGGEEKGKASNSDSISPYNKVRTAYNSMVDLTNVLWDYLQNAVDGAGDALYPEFDIDTIDTCKFEKIGLV